MAEWAGYYTGLAAASATLLGLLFIAVQFQIQGMTGISGTRAHAIARLTLALYMLILIVSLVSLMPGVDAGSQATVLALMIAFGALRSFRSWRTVWRSQKRNRASLMESFRLLLAPLIVYAGIARIAVLLLLGGSVVSNEFDLAGWLIGVLAVALMNSWYLLLDSPERGEAG